MSIKTVEYTLPNYWASALINGDDTGDSDAETAVINEWLADHPHHSCIDVADDSSFTAWHDARAYDVLACDAATFTFYVLP